jgi:type IV secretory pathway VirD2 relaxase
MNRDYLRSGIRIRSQEIATRELGPRLEPEMLRSRELAVRREQWTEIDRALQRKADGNGLVRYDQFQARSEGARIRAEQEIDRLQFLSALGLAQRVDERSWRLSDDHERDLHQRQLAKDVIKSRSRRQRAIDSGMDRVRERGRDCNG